MLVKEAPGIFLAISVLMQRDIDMKSDTILANTMELCVSVWQKVH